MAICRQVLRSNTIGRLLHTVYIYKIPFAGTIAFAMVDGHHSDSQSECLLLRCSPGRRKKMTFILVSVGLALSGHSRVKFQSMFRPRGSILRELRREFLEEYGNTVLHCHAGLEAACLTGRYSAPCRRSRRLSRRRSGGGDRVRRAISCMSSNLPFLDKRDRICSCAASRTRRGAKRIC